MGFSERNHTFEETKDVLIRLELVPVQPTDFVVLVVGIVVAKLRVEEFIAGSEHGDTIRQHEQAA